MITEDADYFIEIFLRKLDSDDAYIERYRAIPWPPSSLPPTSADLKRNSWFNDQLKYLLLMGIQI